jgi:steroid delta-isomerase-like uncharacterized protein
MSVQEHKALVQHVADLWNAGDLAALDACFTADYANRDPNNPGVTDLAGYKRWAAAARAAFPDLQITIEALIAEGDRVAKYWSFVATHQGAFAGAAPTGKRVTWSGITLYRFVGGKAAECIWRTDALGLLQQLGVVSVPTAPVAVGAAR